MANATGAIIGSPSDKIMSTFNMWEPEVAPDFYRIFEDQGLSTFRNMRSLGMVIPVSQDTRQTFSEEKIHQTIHVGSGGISTVSAPAGTYTFLLSVTAGSNDFLASSGSSPYTSTTYYNPVKANDRIMFQGTADRVLATVTSVSGTYPTVTVAITITDLSQTFSAAAYPAGTELSIISNAWGEGTSQPNGLVTKPYIDYEYAQIIKTSFDITGTQMTNQLWFKQYSDSSGNIIGYRTVGQKNAEYEHELAMGGALLFERPSTNAAFVGGAVEPSKTTEGYITYWKRRGLTINYAAGSFGISMFDLIDAQADKNFGPTYYQFGMGRDLYNEKDNSLKQYFQNTMQAYEDPQTVADLFGNNTGLAQTVRFTRFCKGRRTYLFTPIEEFNNPTITDIPGYNTPGLGFVVPIGKKRDTKSGNQLPYMGMGYKNLGTYSRLAEVWTVNGAGEGVKVISEDVAKLNHRSHIMACHVGGNQAVVLERV